MPTVEQPEITLVSTTESQAELDHATGPNWREKFDPAKAAATETEKKNQSAESTEKKDETKTAAASDAAKAASNAGAEEEEDKNLSPGVKKRIDRLTANWKKAEAEAAALKAAQRKPEAEAAKPATNADPEPLVKDFKTWEEWNAAHNRWLVRDENRKAEAATAEEEAKQSAKAIYDAHLERLDTARTAHADFDEAVTAMPKFTFASPAANQAFQMAIVEADNGPELMYHLATHPEEMAKFAELSPVKVQMMIGRLSDKLSPAASTTAARTTPKTKTPPPTTPVRGTTTAPTSLDDPALVKDTDNWIARRQAQIRGQKTRAN
jgi:hypothetical protein